MLSLLLAVACYPQPPKPCLVVTKDNYAIPTNQILYMQEFECEEPNPDKYPCTMIELVDAHLTEKIDYGGTMTSYFQTRITSKDRFVDVVDAYNKCSK